MAARKKSGRTRKGSSSALIGLFTTLAVVAAVIFAIAIFFRVGEITVTGNGMYTSEQILEASGIQEGDYMLTLKKSRAAGSIMVDLPYISEVRIVRTLPDRIHITVRESDTAAAMQSDTGDWWLVNTSGKVLEQVAEARAQQYLCVTGAELISPEAGQPMETDSGTDDIAALLAALDDNELLTTVTSADVSEIYDIRLYCGSLYDVSIGGVSEIDYKIRYLAAVLEELAQSKPDVAGSIDLTFDQDRVARFIESAS